MSINQTKSYSIILQLTSQLGKQALKKKLNLLVHNVHISTENYSQTFLSLEFSSSSAFTQLRMHRTAVRDNMTCPSS